MVVSLPLRSSRWRVSRSFLAASFRALGLSVIMLLMTESHRVMRARYTSTTALMVVRPSRRAAWNVEMDRSVTSMVLACELIFSILHELLLVATGNIVYEWYEVERV